MPKIKHFVMTALILGGIGAASAGLVALTNMITRDTIAQNEKEKIQKGLKEIFGNNASFSDEIKINIQKPYALSGYYVARVSEEQIGYALSISGSNTYGKISMLVGISNDFNIGHFFLINNEQTFASTLVENYVEPYNSDQKELSDVKCGATYGATLIKNMAEYAKDWAQTNLGGNS